MTAEPKHTAGPWKVEIDFHGTRVRSEMIGIQSRIADIANVHGTEQNRANARLIAAAPAMLACLIAQREALHQIAESDVEMDVEVLVGIEYSIEQIDQVISSAIEGN